MQITVSSFLLFSSLYMSSHNYRIHFCLRNNCIRNKVLVACISTYLYVNIVLIVTFQDISSCNLLALYVTVKCECNLPSMNYYAATTAEYYFIISKLETYYRCRHKFENISRRTFFGGSGEDSRPTIRDLHGKMVKS